MQTLRVLLIACAALVAGCTSPSSTDTPTTTPTTTPPADTPTPTTPAEETPTPTTPPEEETPPPAPEGATGISIVRADARGLPGSAALVCWSVEGAGVAKHTAIHFDNESHAGDDATFQMYDGGAVYPGNATAADPEGYALPGDFCATVRVPATGRVWFRAHVINATGSHLLSDEASSAPVGTASSITVTSYEKFATPGVPSTVCWRVEGSGNVPHTALHWDDETHWQPTATFSAYDGGAVYPGNATAAAPGGYDLPGTFCANVPLPPEGPVYFRAHVIDFAGAPGKVTEEVDIHHKM